eukprot:gene11231-4051_t
MSINHDEYIPLVENASKKANEIVDKISKEEKKKHQKYMASCFLQIILTVVILFVILFVATIVLLLPVEALEGGIIFIVFSETDSNKLQFGKFNSYTKKLTVLKTNFFVEGNPKKEITTFDEEGNFYWSSGLHDEAYKINTFGEKYESKLLKYPKFKIHYLFTQPKSKSIYGILSSDETNSYGVYQLIKGKNEKENFTLHENLLTLDSNRFSRSVINSKNHDFLTTYNENGVHKLFIKKLNSTENSRIFQLQNNTLLSLGNFYQEEKVLAFSSRGDTLKIVHLNYDENALKIEKFFVFNKIADEQVKVSTFNFLNGKSYFMFISNIRIVLIDLRRRRYIYVLPNELQNYELNTIQINPKIKV